MTAASRPLARPIPGVKFQSREHKGKLYSYAYHRATGQRLTEPVGSFAFMLEVQRLNESVGLAASTRPVPQIRTRGWIYFIEAEEVALLKIGWSIDPEQRLMQLREQAPIDMRIVSAFAGTISDERRLHRQFKDLRTRSEWFRYEPPLTHLVAKIRREQGPYPWRGAV